MQGALRRHVCATATRASATQMWSLQSSRACFFALQQQDNSENLQENIQTITRFGAPIYDFERFLEVAFQLYGQRSGIHCGVIQLPVLISSLSQTVIEVLNEWRRFRTMVLWEHKYEALWTNRCTIETIDFYRHKRLCSCCGSSNGDWSSYTLRITRTDWEVSKLNCCVDNFDMISYMIVRYLRYSIQYKLFSCLVHVSTYISLSVKLGGRSVWFENVEIRRPMACVL